MEKTVLPFDYSTALEKSKAYFISKRAFDLLCSVLALTVLSIPFGLLTIIQCFVTKGHPFFCDPRIGEKGKTILVLKFRTMYYDAETNIDHYLTPEQKKAWEVERKVDNDPRITGLGRILRKTSLDELPQLVNILIGQMSFVGPRPLSERELYSEFSEQDRELLLSAKPGLTGYWQVYGRNEVDFSSGKRRLYELTYFTKRGLLFDAKLFFMTFGAVFAQKGAQ